MFLRFPARLWKLAVRFLCKAEIVGGFRFGFLFFAVCLLQFFNSLFYLPLMLSHFGEVFYSCRNLLVARLVGRAKS